IALVGLSLMSGLWRSPRRVFVPTMAVTLVFGLFDAFNAAGFTGLVPGVLANLSLAAQGLGWLLPVLVTLVAAALVDRLRGVPASQAACPRGRFRASLRRAFWRAAPDLWRFWHLLPIAAGAGLPENLRQL